MKTLRFLFLASFLFLSFRLAGQAAAPGPSSVGAWRAEGEPERVMIVTANYWTQAIYVRESPQFVRTFGGTYVANGENVEGGFEFDSAEPHRVGERFSLRMQVDGPAMTLTHTDGSVEKWTRIDAGGNALAGVWRISGRHANGTMTEMPLRARRTLKILSGTRFQWVAMNVETGEFSGTGGGTYTFENGKYTEHIEFFSRDNARVGAKLEFDGEIEAGAWRHRGLSSRGDPIDEVWTRFEAAK